MGNGYPRQMATWLRSEQAYLTAMKRWFVFYPFLTTLYFRAKLTLLFKGTTRPQKNGKSKAMMPSSNG
jgi:hypothetical protein